MTTFKKYLSVVALVVFGSALLVSCNPDSVTEDENLYETDPIEIGIDKADIEIPN